MSEAPEIPGTPRSASSQYSFSTLNFVRGDEINPSLVSLRSSTNSPVFADAVQRQGDTQIHFRILPFLGYDRAVLETADDEYYLLPCYAKRVILRRQDEQFAVRIADVRVEEVEMRLGVGQGARRLAIEYEGRRRAERVILKDPKARIWKELDKCVRAARDVRSLVLVMLEREEEPERPEARRTNASRLRAAVRSLAGRRTSR